MKTHTLSRRGSLCQSHAHPYGRPVGCGRVCLQQEYPNGPETF